MKEHCTIMQRASYLPVITQPSIVTDETFILLDHNSTAQLDKVVSGVVDIYMNDYYPTSLSIYLDIAPSTDILMVCIRYCWLS